MKNKIISVLLAVCMLTVFVACNKDEETAGGENNSEQAAGHQTVNENGENADAWWQQYTTEPTGTTKASTTKKGLFGNDKKETTTKKATKTTKKSNASTTKAPAEPYTKVDANTMKYNVKDNSGNTGVVTLTKASSNTYIKQAVEAVNSNFGTSYTAANAICYNSTLQGMSGFNLVYIFSGTSKSASNLQLVIQFSGSNPISFIGMNVQDENGNSQNVTFPFWPIASAGSESYNSYLETFKTGCEETQSGYYDQGSNTFKSMLDGDNVKTFLSW